MASSVAELVALGKLLEEHRSRLGAMVERRLDPALRARVSADDILQEASLLAQRRYVQFKADGRMTAYAWLYRLALDALLEAWRRHNRSPRDVGRDLALVWASRFSPREEVRPAPRPARPPQPRPVANVRAAAATMIRPASSSRRGGVPCPLQTRFPAEHRG